MGLGCFISPNLSHESQEIAIVYLKFYPRDMRHRVRKCYFCDFCTFNVIAITVHFIH